MGEDDKTLEEGQRSTANALRLKQEFQRVLIDGIGVLPGEHLDQFAQRLVRELQSWRTGARRRSLPAIESVPDVTSTAAALARQSWDEEKDHGELMRSAAGTLANLGTTATVLLAERDTLRWLHAEAAFERDRLKTDLAWTEAELSQYDPLTDQECENGHPDHPRWLVESEYTEACPWCEMDRLRCALNALRDSHHIPYVDEDHQGGNCADIVIGLVGRAVRAERAAAQAEASRRDWAAEAARLDMDVDRYRDMLHAIWLYVDWRYLTKQLTTEQKELWADAVETTSRALEPDEPLEMDRWWRGEPTTPSDLRDRVRVGVSDTTDAFDDEPDKLERVVDSVVGRLQDAGFRRRHVDVRPCACISDDQAASLGPGFSRPVCAVHPTPSDLQVPPSLGAWRTHPKTGVMHVLMPGADIGECGWATVPLDDWRPAADGNARCLPCMELAPRELIDPTWQAVGGDPLSGTPWAEGGEPE